MKQEMITLLKMKAMKVLYHMNQRQRLKTMSTPLRNPVPTMKSITMKKMWLYVIIEAMCKVCEVCKKLVCRKHSHKTLGVTCNNGKDGPLTSWTVAIDAGYILLTSQRFRYSKFHIVSSCNHIFYIQVHHFTQKPMLNQSLYYTIGYFEAKR